jgi:hypothetical protein
MRLYFCITAVDHDQKYCLLVEIVFIIFIFFRLVFLLQIESKQNGRSYFAFHPKTRTDFNQLDM